jgi:hypothetical protein
MSWTFPPAVTDFTSIVEAAGVTTGGTYGTIDISSVVPAGTKTIWARIRKTASVFPYVGLASGGLSANPPVCLMQTSTPMSFMVGLDGSNQIKYYVTNNTTVAWEILGYSTEDVTFPEGATTTYEVIANNTGWVDVTLSTLPTDAVFGILLARNSNASAAYLFGLADDGATPDTPTSKLTGLAMGSFFLPVTSKVGQIYREDYNYEKLYPMGWLSTDWNKLTPTEITLSGTGWLSDVDLSSVLTDEDTTMVLFEAVNTGASDYNFAYREPSSTENIVSYIALKAGCKIHGMMACPGRVVDFYRSNTAVTVTAIGYYTGLLGDPPPAEPEVPEKIVNGGFETGTVGNFPSTGWSATTGLIPLLSGRNQAYTVLYGTRVRPTVANGYFYFLSTAGTTGAAEPTWGTVVGQTTQDGTAYWTCAGALAATSLIDDAEHYSGTKSLKILGPGLVGLNQTVSVTPGKRYKITCKVKEQSVDTYHGETWNNNKVSGFLIYIKAHNGVTGTRNVGQFYDVGIRTCGWQDYYLMDYVAAEDDDTLSIFFEGRLGDASMVWIDDVSILGDTGAPVKNFPRQLVYTDANYSLSAAHQQDEIFKADAAPAGPADTTLTVNAVKNERVSWQLSVIPAAEWTNVTWNITDFIGTGGTIDASGVVVNRVAYVNVGTGVANNAYYMRTGVSPDPMPIEAASTLAASENSPFFFTVHVPPNAAAGDYTGSITLVKDGVNKAAITITLSVANVVLPEEPIMRSEVGVSQTIMGKPTSHIPIHENLWNHRSVKTHSSVYTHVYSGGAYTFDGGYHFYEPDGTVWDFDAECAYFVANMPGYIPKSSVPTVWVYTPTLEFGSGGDVIGIFLDPLVGDEPNPTFQTRFTQMINDLWDKYAALGIEKIYYRFRDEAPNTGVEWKAIRETARLIKATGHPIELWLNAKPNPNDPDYIDSCITASAYLPFWEAVQDEFTYPSYYSNPFMSLGHNLPSIKYRLLSWALYQYGLKGNGWWTILFDGADPWAGDFSDFNLIYPPRAGVDTAGVPVNSIRWEAYRQGLQDADLLWTLDSLITTKNGLVLPSLITAARAILARVSEVVTHLPLLSQDVTRGCHYDQFCSFDVELVEEIRQEVVDAIISLTNASGFSSGGMYINIEMEM